MQRLDHTIKIFKQFRSYYDYYKENLGMFFKNRPPVLWTINPNSIFQRSTLFIERLEIIKWFFTTVLEFLKLEKIEIGGLKGRILSAKIQDISSDFNRYFTVFASKTYDVLDPADPSFQDDFDGFQEKILELDLKLCAVLCQAFDECCNLEAVFKVNICLMFVIRFIILLT